jgi:glycosyltransferase involved in cell wall biosynthesis
VEMEVIRNVPLPKPVNTSIKTPDFLPDKKFVLYQGALNKGRGLELVIDAFEYIEGFVLLIAGDGDISMQLKDRIISKKLEQKVVMCGKIPFDDLYALTTKAALGISIEENLGLNYCYALPNKLFDYIQAHIPVLVSDLPEMKKIVEDYDIGEVLISRDPEKVAAQIQAMIVSPKRGIWIKNLKKASEELNWEKEKTKLLDLFDKITR